MTDELDSGMPGGIGDPNKGGSDASQPYPGEPYSYDPSIPLPDEAKEGIWTVASHVIGEVLDVTGLGPALHTITMETDNPVGMAAGQELDWQAGLADDLASQRASGMSESLGSYAGSMEATAPREQEPEVFEP